LIKPSFIAPSNHAIIIWHLFYHALHIHILKLLLEISFSQNLQLLWIQRKKLFLLFFFRNRHLLPTRGRPEEARHTKPNIFTIYNYEFARTHP
jgi:hypothetical protein